MKRGITVDFQYSDMVVGSNAGIKSAGDGCGGWRQDDAR